MASSNDEFSTTIGPDAVIKGQLQFEKGIRLMGKVEGEIDTGGELFIGESATLSGDAKAATIRLEGRVKGNLTADSKVQLSASARLEGDLQTARLEVAEGAVLVGRCSIGVDGKGQSRNAGSTTKAATPGTSTAAIPDKTKPDDSRRRS